MIKIIKQNYKKLLIVLLYGLITYGIYFNAHYVHDSYRIYNFGFLQNLNGFWTQGRPISMCFNILFDFLKISPRIGQIISVFLTILFLAISSIIIYNMIINRIEKNNTADKKTKFIILLVSAFLFFNVYITEWMMFLESCIIALGTLLSIIGCYYLFKDQSIFKKYIYSTIFFVFGIFCYQASISIAGALVVLFTIYDNKDKNILDIIKQVILNMMPYLIAMIANFVFVKIIGATNPADVRLSGKTNYLYNILFVFKQIHWYLIAMFDFPTKYAVPLLLTIALVYGSYKTFKNKPISLLYVLTPLVALWFLSVLPILAMASDNIYFMARSVPFMASVVPFFILSIYLFNEKKVITNKLFLGILIVYVAVTTVSIILVTSECLKNNKQDIQIAQTIQNEIDNYEKVTNNKIDTILLLPDSNKVLYSKNMKSYGDNTVRALNVDYGAKEIMYFVSQRIYNIFMGTPEQKQEIFGDVEWDEFSTEQIKFNGNTLYLLNY